MAQTALQELIEFVKNMEYHYTGLDNVLSKAQSLLPKERQDIIDAIDYAATCDAAHGYIPTGEDYFNQTFNQK